MSSTQKTFFMLLFLICTPFLCVSAVELHPQTFGNLAAYFNSEDCHERPTAPNLINKASDALKTLPSPENGGPKVVSALWVEGRCYFASSMKGTGTVIGSRHQIIPKEVHEGLQRTMNLGSTFNVADAYHQHQARCGEVMVLALWSYENPGKKLPADKLIVAVDKNGPKPPCKVDSMMNPQAVFGCHDVLKDGMEFGDGQIITKRDRACRRLGRAAKGIKKSGSPVVTTGSKGKVPRRGGKAPRRGAKHKRSVLPRSGGWNAQ